MLVAVGPVGLERGMPFPASNCTEQTSTALQRKVVGSLQSSLQGPRLSGSCPWWVGGVHTDSRARSHTYTHHSDRWPIEIISELFCGCYDNQCSLGFHLAMWQGLWRQLEAEPVAEPAQAKACERLGGCWLPPLLSTLLLLRPRGCGAWTVKSCTSAVWGNQFALYTIVRRVYKSQWLSPLSHLLQVCLHEQLLLYPEAKMWSSFELFIWGGISGIWLNLDSCSGK